MKNFLIILFTFFGITLLSATFSFKVSAADDDADDDSPIISAEDVLEGLADPFSGGGSGHGHGGPLDVNRFLDAWQTLYGYIFPVSSNKYLTYIGKEGFGADNVTTSDDLAQVINNSGLSASEISLIMREALEDYAKNNLSVKYYKLDIPDYVFTILNYRSNDSFLQLTSAYGEGYICLLSNYRYSADGTGSLWSIKTNKIEADPKEFYMVLPEFFGGGSAVGNFPEFFSISDFEALDSFSFNPYFYSNGSVVNGNRQLAGGGIYFDNGALNSFFGVNNRSYSFIMCNQMTYIPIYKSLAEADKYSLGLADVYTFNPTAIDLDLSKDIDYTDLLNQIRDKLDELEDEPFDYDKFEKIIQDSVSDYLENISGGIEEGNEWLEKIYNYIASIGQSSGFPVVIDSLLDISDIDSNILEMFYILVGTPASTQAAAGDHEEEEGFKRGNGLIDDVENLLYMIYENMGVVDEVNTYLDPDKMDDLIERLENSSFVDKLSQGMITDLQFIQEVLACDPVKPEIQIPVNMYGEEFGSIDVEFSFYDKFRPYVILFLDLGLLFLFCFLSYKFASYINEVIG